MNRAEEDEQPLLVPAGGFTTGAKGGFMDFLNEYYTFVDEVVKKFISENNLSPSYFLEAVHLPDQNTHVELAIQLDRWGITVNECREIYNNDAFSISIGWEWRLDDLGEPVINSESLPEFSLYISRESISHLENKYPRLAEGERRGALIESFMGNLSVLEFELRKRYKYSIYYDVDTYRDLYKILMAGLVRWRGHGNSQKYLEDMQSSPDKKQESLAVHTSSRTQKATFAKSQNIVEKWKGIFPRMVRIYARMEQDHIYERKEVAELFEAEGVALHVSKGGRITDARLDYFWQTFTDSGRPIDLTKCGQPDERAAALTGMAP